MKHRRIERKPVDTHFADPSSTIVVTKTTTKRAGDFGPVDAAGPLFPPDDLRRQIRAEREHRGGGRAEATHTHVITIDQNGLYRRITLSVVGASGPP